MLIGNIYIHLILSEDMLTEENIVSMSFIVLNEDQKHILDTRFMWTEANTHILVVVN